MKSIESHTINHNQELWIVLRCVAKGILKAYEGLVKGTSQFIPQTFRCSNLVFHEWKNRRNSARPGSRQPRSRMSWSSMRSVRAWIDLGSRNWQMFQHQWAIITDWLVVTGTWLLFSIYWECHHPNSLSYFSEQLKPPIRSDHDYSQLSIMIICAKWPPCVFHFFSMCFTVFRGLQNPSSRVKIMQWLYVTNGIIGMITLHGNPI